MAHACCTSNPFFTPGLQCKPAPDRNGEDVANGGEVKAFSSRGRHRPQDCGLVLDNLGDIVPAATVGLSYICGLRDFPDLLIRVSLKCWEGPPIDHFCKI